MLRGLPASGKTTRRREMLADPAYAPIVAVSKDDIRKRLGIALGDFEREKEVRAEERRQIAEALSSGCNLVIDNLHNAPRYLRRYQRMAAQHNYNFELIELSGVAVEECIRRDALRPKEERVGKGVILRMYNEHYRKSGLP